MTQDYEQMEIQAEVLFRYDLQGRMTEVNEPASIDAPLFFLGRTRDGNVVRFHKSFPDVMIPKVLAFLNSDPFNVDLRKLIAMMNDIKQLHTIWMGPAYAFPTSVNRSSNAIQITNDNKEVLRRSFPHVWEQFEWRQPCFAVIEDEIAVSVCCSARRSAKAAEASVETLRDYQGKGYATESVIAWANEVRMDGLQPLYSTAWDHFSSQSIARKLGLHQYGVDFHVS